MKEGKYIKTFEKASSELIDDDSKDKHAMIEDCIDKISKIGRLDNKEFFFPKGLNIEDVTEILEHKESLLSQSSKYVFQLYGDSFIYEEFESAHKKIYLNLSNPENDLPYKVETYKGGLALKIHYPNFHNIVRWVLL